MRGERRRERRAGAGCRCAVRDAGRPSVGQTPRCVRSDSLIEPRTRPVSSPVASSSGLPWREPGERAGASPPRRADREPRPGATEAIEDRSSAIAQGGTKVHPRVAQSRPGRPPRRGRARPRSRGRSSSTDRPHHPHRPAHIRGAGLHQGRTTMDILRRSLLTLAAAGLLALPLAVHAQISRSPSLSTTSTEQSGLFKHLLPPSRRRPGST